jgi:uncharacterized membrane protein
MKTVAAFIAACGLICGVLLLISDVPITAVPFHTWLSALPLALIGVAYALLLIRVRPDAVTLAKRLILAGTFILWAFDQFLPPGRFSTIVSDIVVSAYVLDLYWIIQEQRNS